MQLAILALAAAVALSGTTWAASDKRVPFVGCRSDGQMGPIGPPKVNGTVPKLPVAAAMRLTWYASNNTGGVFGPRGWRCFELYGSNGSVLMVTPNGVGRDPFTAKLPGPAIQLSVSSGETSGRFEAAKIAARLFPTHRAFADEVIGEAIEPKQVFVFHPFPRDRITRLTGDAVEFETPANEDGVGTMSRLIKSSDPIQGLVWMDADNNATLLAVRLAPSQRDLAASIVGAMKPAQR
jgi:hypothetical protein